MPIEIVGGFRESNGFTCECAAFGDRSPARQHLRPDGTPGALRADVVARGKLLRPERPTIGLVEVSELIDGFGEICGCGAQAAPKSWLVLAVGAQRSSSLLRRLEVTGEERDVSQKAAAELRRSDLTELVELLLGLLDELTTLANVAAHRDKAA